MNDGKHPSARDAAPNPAPAGQPLSVAQLQIVVTALIFGVVVLSGIAIFMHGRRPPGNPILTYIAAGLTIVELITARFILAALTGKARRQLSQRPEPSKGSDETDDRHKLFMVYQTRVILRYALLEGVAVLNAVAYLLEGVWWSLLLVAALLGMMALSFPTPRDVEHWVRDQLENSQFE